MSTCGRLFVGILQDRRYWVIHLVTIPNLFLFGALAKLSGFVYKLFGVPTLNQCFTYDRPYICVINDRFSALSEIGTFSLCPHSRIGKHFSTRSHYKQEGKTNSVLLYSDSMFNV